MGILLVIFLVAVSLFIIFASRSVRFAIVVLIPAYVVIGVTVLVLLLASWKVNGIEVSPGEGWNIWSGDSSHIIVVKKENPGNVAVPGLPLKGNTAKLETPLVVLTSRERQPPEKPEEWQEYLRASIGKFFSEVSTPQLSAFDENERDSSVLVVQSAKWVNGSQGDVTILTTGYRVEGKFVAVSVAVRNSDKLAGAMYLRNAKTWMVSKSK